MNEPDETPWAIEPVVEVDVEVDTDDPAHAEALKAMFELHRDVGRQAIVKAMSVLDQTDAADIPIQVAVQLLKFGADLERRALLGIEPDDDDDPFKTLAGAIDGS